MREIGSPDVREIGSPYVGEVGSVGEIGSAGGIGLVSGPRVLVAAWVGSTNLGDELVFAGLTRLLRERGAEITVLSVDPQGTRASHGVEAVSAHDPRAVWAAVGRADAVVLGGGGLLQDETSPFNLPYHLVRVALARARRTPYAGVGLGAGRLTTRTGQAMVRAAMRHAVAVSVRDEDSADLLESIGLRRPAVAADLAFALPSPEVAARDRLVVCLRPWAGKRGVKPAAWAAPHTPTEWLDGTACALDEAARSTGLAPHFVALQADWDGPLHEQVAARMSSEATFATPAVHELTSEIATGRFVVSTRFHGGVAAALAGRPAVLIGYSPKVESLARDLGDGARLLPWTRQGPEALSQAIGQLSESGVRVAADRLRRRQAGNAAAVDALLERVSSPR